jgi:hypothetical protein
MKVRALNTITTAEAAAAALQEYKQNRDVYDGRDWEIERIYRAIARGKTVISINSAIRNAGTDEFGRPRLAIMRADQERCICRPYYSDSVLFTNTDNRRHADLNFEIPWPSLERIPCSRSIQARLPRIPPRHRPKGDTLAKYHLLWEADWSEIPRDPYLLKRIGKDAWIVLAEWDLTEVELLVLRTNAK